MALDAAVELIAIEGGEFNGDSVSLSLSLWEYVQVKNRYITKDKVLQTFRKILFLHSE